MPLALALGAALTLAACGQDTQPYSATSAVGAPASDQMSSATPAPDRDFLTDVVTANATEIQMGQLAQEKASNADVKAYAKMLVDDHEQAGESLQKVLSDVNTQVAPKTEAVTDARGKLADLSGAKFDRAFIDMMVSDHEDAVNKLQDKIKGSGNPQVQAWATKTLPTLQAHLQRARDLQQTLSAS
jgi:putative membrane protein